MIACTAERIAEICGGELVAGPADAIARATEIDSRRVGPEHVFFAIVGPRDDGHRYLKAAAAAGASVLVIEPGHGPIESLRPTAAVVQVPDSTRALQDLARAIRRQVNPLVIAITGSVGKTTTKTLTYSLLRGTRPTHASPGNFNNQWGLPLSLLGLEPQHEWMVAELGMSRPGEIAALARLATPTIGVITNVAPVHMENFAGIDDVAAAKRELASALPADGTLVLNAEDPRTLRFRQQFRDRVDAVLTYGLGSGDVRALELTPSGSGWSLMLQLPESAPEPVSLPLPGEHSVANFLAAATVAHVLEIPAGEIARRAATLQLPHMRGQVHRTRGDVTILDDSYNASPAAMISALEMLAGLPGGGRLVLVGGDMRELGAWSEEAHREVGLHAVQLGFQLICTVGVLARDIGQGAIAAGLPADAVHSFRTPEEAAEELKQLLQAGDRVLVKGSRAVHMEIVTETLVQQPLQRAREGC